MSNEPTLAETMWNAYAEQAGGKTFDGKPLPTWPELGEDRQSCWHAAAAAACSWLMIASAANDENNG